MLFLKQSWKIPLSTYWAAVLILIVPVNGYAEEDLMHQIDSLLELPEPEIPDELRKSLNSNNQHDQTRLSRQIKELFYSSPIESAVPSQETPDGIERPKEPPMKTYRQ